MHERVDYKPSLRPAYSNRYCFCCRANKIVATALSAVVIAVNIFVVVQTVRQELPHNWAILFGMSVYAILYLLFCAYLIIHMAVSMGATSLGNHWVCIFVFIERALYITSLNHYAVLN